MKTNGESVYTCGICGVRFKSLKELTAHYEKDHPEMIEELIMPI